METTSYSKQEPFVQLHLLYYDYWKPPALNKHYSWYVAQITELQSIGIMQFSACDPRNTIISIYVLLDNSIIQNHNLNNSFPQLYAI